MPKIEMMLQHGWGLNSNMWKSFIKSFAEFEIHNLDRGYFYQGNKASFTNDFSFKIGVVHSLGLHIFPKDLFSSLNVLIIFSSFLNFHQKYLDKTIALMQNKLENNPIELLNNFYHKSTNHSSNSNKQYNIDTKKLVEDLDLLKDANFDIDLIKKIPTIMLFHSTQDKIVNFDKAMEFKNKLNQAKLFDFEGASHMLSNTHIRDIVPIIKKHLAYEEKIYKSKIINSFSKQTNNYEKNNHFQKKANKDLLKILKQNVAKKIKGPILEIGAGTGDFSKNIIKNFPNEKIEITDLCQSMIDYCKNHLSNKNIKFYALDGEKLNKKKYYSMVVSSITIQWFYSIERSFQQIKQSLSNDGLFLFSFLENDSFNELKDINLDKIILNPLPSINEVEYYLKKKFSGYELQRKSYTFTYPSILSFFQSLKNTGANAALFQNTKNPYSLLAAIKRINSMPFSITYKIGIGVARR